MAKSCVIYSRVSTAEQAAPGHHSLDAQEALCRRYCEREGYWIAELIRDEGYSGRTTNRPGFRRLLEYTSTQPPCSVQAILVQDISRIGRDTTEYLLFRRELQRRGIELISVTQPNIDTSPEGRLVDTILAGVNSYDSEQKGRRVSIALEKKFREGWWPGWAPVGYLNVVVGGHKQVAADPTRFPLVQLAFRLYATGRYTQDRLREVLVEKGLTGRDGRPLPRMTLNHLLANPFYWGLLRFNGHKRMGQHPPTTDHRTWEKCQAVTAEHNRYVARRSRHRFLLAGLTVCARCGTHQTHSVVARKGKRYYHCNSRAQCDEPYVLAEDLEAQAARALNSIRLTDAFIGRVVAKVRCVFKDRDREIQAERTSLLRKKEALEQKRNLAEEKLLSGVLSDDAFTRANRRLVTQLTSITNRLTDLEDARQVDTDSLQQILRLARDIPTAYHQAPDDLKQRYLRFFFTHFSVRDRKIVKAHPTEFLAALQKAGSVRSTPNWLPGRELVRTVGVLLRNTAWLREKLEIGAGVVGELGMPVLAQPGAEE
jgi:DNA invertase Pin-like site-specific DNA recombinase